MEKLFIHKGVKSDEEIRDEIIREFMINSNRQYAKEWHNYIEIKGKLEPIVLEYE